MSDIVSHSQSTKAYDLSDMVSYHTEGEWHGVRGMTSNEAMTTGRHQVAQAPCIRKGERDSDRPP